MSTEEHINQLTAQVAALQAQLACHSQSPPPPQPSAAPTPPKLPKVATPTLFSGAQDNLDHFKAECSLYLSMRSAEFMDEQSSVLFVLSYMKGGSAGPWATQKINRILDAANPAETMWVEFMIELNKMFTDPNCQATTRRKLATLHQGDSSIEELIQEFKIHGSISGLGNIGLVDCFEQAIHPQLCVTTCASRSRSRMWRNPTGDDRVSSAHEHGRGVKVASSTTALAHQFPPPSLSGC